MYEMAMMIPSFPSLKSSHQGVTMTFIPFIQIPRRRYSAISRYGKNGKYCLSDGLLPRLRHTKC